MARCAGAPHGDPPGDAHSSDRAGGDPDAFRGFQALGLMASTTKAQAKGGWRERWSSSLQCKLVQQHWREHKACGDQEYRACVQRVRNHCLWLCFRFSLSYVEEMMAERGVAVTCETVRQWCRI